MTSNLRSSTPDPHPSLADAVSVSRFWSLVDRGPVQECWEWLGYRDDDGYGIFNWHGRRTPAHQLAVSFTTGEVKSEGLDTCHSCDNPPCVNPAHLRFDTRLANVADMDGRGRRAVVSKITPEQVVEMRERRANGARQSDLAEQYGLAESSVSLIVRGKRWANIGGPIENKENPHG